MCTCMRERRGLFLGTSSSHLYNNPFLVQGDIITVQKGIVNRGNEVINEILSPVTKLFNSYALYKAINE